MRIDNDYAYLLHAKPYRDNSVIADFLTLGNGKVSVIVTGIKSPKSPKKALLQPCRCLSLTYILKSGLSKIVEIEQISTQELPSIEHFMLYQYAHEVLLHILPQQLPVEPIFNSYRTFLKQLIENRKFAALRCFERSLIEQFSGFPDISFTQDTQRQIIADKRYFFYPDRGVYEYACDGAGHGVTIDGVSFLAFEHVVQSSAEELEEEVARQSQALSTCLIHQLLNGKQLKTRQILRELNAL